MAKKTDEIKKRILNEVLSTTELENIMAEFEYILVEADEDNDTIKFTNYISQIWIEGETDADGNVLVEKVKVINRIESEPTKVDPFHSYEDLEKVLNWFWNNRYYNHWIVAWLMTALGRRVGDTTQLKWLDIYKRDGSYRERLTQLKEEKTGKKVAPVLNALAIFRVEEYVSVANIQPMENYTEEIVDIKPGAFRKMLKKAVLEVGITYPVSTHSFRKYWANTIYKLHPQDCDNLMIIQSMLGHSDVQTTKIYIGEIDNKIDKYNEDYSDYMLGKKDGVDTEVSNSPLMVIKAEDFRQLLSDCWDMAKGDTEKFEGINALLKLAEQKVI